MEIKERKIKGVFEIVLNPHMDDRGFFMRTFDNNIFKEKGIDRNWVQENHARSIKKGIIRGLHFQLPPFSEAKLIRCIRGAFLDVFLDLRYQSETFGQWDSMELNEENKKMIFIPRGFAHGYCTLTNVSEILYKADNFYNPEKESGIIWNDRDLKIDWPDINPILSEKDKLLMNFNKFKTNNPF